MRRFDVVIVGAGPAGSVAARDLSWAGARVAIVDGSHPREKPCGGGVTGRALDLARLSETGSAAVDTGRVIERVVFEAGRRTTAVDLRSGNDLRVFSRETFDTALLSEASQAGAVVVRARAKGIARSATGWTITTDAGPLGSSWLLGADGAGGIVRKQVFRPFERRQISIAAGSYVDDVETAEIAIAFVDTPRGYLWSFPRSGHLAVGACAQANETTTAEMHAIADAWIDRYPAAAGRRRRRYAWPIPSLGAADLDAERPAGDGWLLLGDAAGLVDPITREGIFFALRSGILAAAAIRDADPSRVYATSVRDELHGELRRAARLKAGFYRPRFTRLLIEALEHSETIRRVMVDLVAGRQSYRGLKRRLVSTLEIGLMWKLVRPITSPGTRHGHAPSHRDVRRER